jgi:hypothetical protein
MRQNNEMRARTKHAEWASGVAADFTNDGVLVDVELADLFSGNTLRGVHGMLPICENESNLRERK